MRPHHALFRRFIPILAIVAVIAGCSDSQDSQSQHRQAPPPKVGVVTLHKQAVELFDTLPGRTAPYRVAQVRPQVSGIIQKREFKEGSKVRKGQVLYQIDPRTYRAAYDSAKADLAKAKAAVSSVKPKARRYKDLLSSHAVSQQEYDDVQAQLLSSQAQVQVAKAALQSARINLHYTKVKSPIDGRIGRSYVTEGALVTASQAQKLAQVTQLDPIYVDIQRPSEEVLRLKQELSQGKLTTAGHNQAKVTLYLPGGRKYARTGKLQFSGVTVDPDTSSVTLRAVFPNPDHDVLPGMFVHARLSEGVRQNALLVPQQGVTHDRKGQATALVVGKGDTVERRVLTTDRAIGPYWLVSAGVLPGDKVIVSGLQGVQQGSKVRSQAAHIHDKPVDGTTTAGPGGKLKGASDTGDGQSGSSNKASATGQSGTADHG